MSPTPRTRRIAAILAVAFLLTAVWAGFYLYSEVHPANGGPSAPTLASFSGDAVGSFAASLSPSYLYNNSTEISGGNVTLFSSITNWINASVDYSFTANRTVSLTLVETFAVVLSTPVWSKTLYSTVNSTSVPATENTTLAFAYDANVSSVVALATAIDNQLGYSGPGYALTLEPTITGNVGVDGFVGSFQSAPFLNFSFTGALISPSGLTHAASGTVLGPVPSSALSLSAAVVPVAALMGSIGGLGGSTWIATRRPEEAPLPPLDELIRPYEEAIALVSAAPAEVATTPVRTFPDLVKIADILGKPILRPATPESARTSFYVVDGRVSYAYRYPSEGPPGAGPEPTTPAREYSARSAELARRLRNDLLALEARRPEGRSSESARLHARRALDALSSGDEAGAEREIAAIERTLSRSRPPRP